MHGILKGNIHYWDNTQGKLLLSFESTKQLLTFNTIDDCINHLFINGYKEQARELNKVKH